MSHQLVIDYRESLPNAMQISPELFEMEARMARAVKLFEMKRLSAAKNAAVKTNTTLFFKRK